MCDVNKGVLAQNLASRVFLNNSDVSRNTFRKRYEWEGRNVNGKMHLGWSPCSPHGIPEEGHSASSVCEVCPFDQHINILRLGEDESSTLGIMQFDTTLPHEKSHDMNSSKLSLHRAYSCMLDSRDNFLDSCGTCSAKDGDVDMMLIYRNTGEEKVQIELALFENMQGPTHADSKHRRSSGFAALNGPKDISRRGMRSVQERLHEGFVLPMRNTSEKHLNIVLEDLDGDDADEVMVLLHGQIYHFQNAQTLQSQAGNCTNVTNFTVGGTSSYTTNESLPCNVTDVGDTSDEAKSFLICI